MDRQRRAGAVQMESMRRSRGVGREARTKGETVEGSREGQRDPMPRKLIIPRLQTYMLG
jgi:hypothetical protein